MPDSVTRRKLSPDPIALLRTQTSRLLLLLAVFLLLHELFQDVRSPEHPTYTIVSSYLPPIPSDRVRCARRSCSGASPSLTLLFTPCPPSRRQPCIPRARGYANPPARPEKTPLEPPRPSAGHLSGSVEARQSRSPPRPLFLLDSTLPSPILPTRSPPSHASFADTIHCSRRLTLRHGRSKKICLGCCRFLLSRNPSLILPTRRLLSGV